MKQAQAGRGEHRKRRVDAEAERLTKKARRLKQLFEKMPERSIPELQYLGAQWWLDRAKTADLETDAGVAKACVT